MKFKIKVHPNSSKEEIKKTNEGLEVWLKQKSENSKANLALIKLLKKHFNKDARIKSGFKSKNKIVEMSD
jgi:uncharacterized protein (TIGR00251 family)